MEELNQVMNKVANHSTTQVSSGTTDLSISDVEEVMEMLETMYPDSFKFSQAKNTEGWNRRCALWQRQLSRVRLTKEDVLNALEYINANDEKDKIPAIAKVIAQGEVEKRNRLNRQGKSGRRIMYVEEDCANEFEEMFTSVKQGKIQRNKEVDDKMLQLYDYWLLYHDAKGEPEGSWKARYLKHFGKPREESERL